MIKSESITKLTLALSKFQGEVKNPPNSADNPFFKSKYAPLDVVINTAKDSLTKFGLSYIQMPGGDGEHVTCVTVLMCEGEWIESDVLVLKADKITAQGAGAAITYARRFQLTAMLGLAGEEDTDGNVNVPVTLKTETKGELNEKQVSRLYAIAHSAGVDHLTVLKHIEKKFKATSTSNLTKEQYTIMCKGYEEMKLKSEVVK